MADAVSAASARPTTPTYTAPTAPSRPTPNSTGNLNEQQITANLNNNSQPIYFSQNNDIAAYGQNVAPGPVPVQQGGPAPAWVNQTRYNHMTPAEHQRFNQDREALAANQKQQLGQITASVTELAAKYPEFQTSGQAGLILQQTQEIDKLITQGANPNEIQDKFNALNTELAKINAQAQEKAKKEDAEAKDKEFAQEMEKMQQQHQQEMEKMQQQINMLMAIVASKDDDGDKKKGIGGLFAALTPPILTGNA